MENPEAHEDQRYIEALLNNDHRLIREIYEKWSGKVVAFVRKNNGDESQARDIIQETLIIIYRQAYEKKLILSCPFEAYFFLLCKRRWFNILKQKGLEKVTINDDLTSIDRADELADSTEQFEIRQDIIKSQFSKLTAKCRELINLTLEIKSMKTVAEKLNVSYAYLRKKKSLCMGQLTKLVRESKEYNQLNE